ncbi:unnamed protein product, partial [Mesorhabditis spiculigera]
MQTIFLTGGIASGKSMVTQTFRERGIPVIDADQIARDVVEPGTATYQKLRAEFGSQYFDDENNGKLKRKELGDLIFNNTDKRRRLNAITHGAIRWEIFKLFFSALFRGENTVLLDIPLLFEAGIYKYWPLSTVMVVYCTREQQITRLMARDGYTEEEAVARVNSQMSIEEKKAKADIVVENRFSKEELIHTASLRVDDFEASWAPFKARLGLLVGAVFLFGFFFFRR